MKNFNQSHFCNGTFQKPRHPFHKHISRLPFMCCDIPRNLMNIKNVHGININQTFIVNTSPALKACCISTSSPCPSLPHNNWAFLFSSTKFNRSDLTKMCCFSFWCNSVDCDVPTLPFFWRSKSSNWKYYFDVNQSIFSLLGCSPWTQPLPWHHPQRSVGTSKQVQFGTLKWLI